MSRAKEYFCLLAQTYNTTMQTRICCDMWQLTSSIDSPPNRSMLLELADRYTLQNISSAKMPLAQKNSIATTGFYIGLATMWCLFRPLVLLRWACPTKTCFFV